ncbi:MAG: glycosyltransferase family A protein [Caulobacteraceae bacterium]
MSSDTRLSVVLGTFNRLAALRRCLDSIVRETRTPFHVYVADAGSTDGAQAYLRSWATHGSVRSWPASGSPGAGLQRCVPHPDQPYVAWLSDDNEVVEGGLDRAVAILDREPAVGMVALKTADVQGPFLGSAYIGGVSEIRRPERQPGRPAPAGAGGGRLFQRGVRLLWHRPGPDRQGALLRPRHRLHARRRPAPLPRLADGRGRAGDGRPGGAPTSARCGSIARVRRLRRRRPAWRARRRFWAWLKKRLRGRYDENSLRPVLGGLWRDWNNVFLSRHIGLFDPWLSLGRDWHLRQRAPRRPLPPDPPAGAP